ncbi:hypothetical protein BP6252_00743 [Coleophoma cylindrospora]|uniref:HORMA domain-containing protein n=1 Tax=Coleophoma cylindrospora TaxID=1849047 RepID=A0A3D8SRB2_9HELO|nr:hypothetical protein BP6252_00743 [Coleophoma cylindrospora]
MPPQKRKNGRFTKGGKSTKGIQIQPVRSDSQTLSDQNERSQDQVPQRKQLTDISNVVPPVLVTKVQCVEYVLTTIKLITATVTHRRNIFSDANYAHINIDMDALVASHDALLECEVKGYDSTKDYDMLAYCFRPDGHPRIKKLLHLIDVGAREALERGWLKSFDIIFHDSGNKIIERWGIKIKYNAGTPSIHVLSPSSSQALTQPAMKQLEDVAKQLTEVLFEIWPDVLEMGDFPNGTRIAVLLGWNNKAPPQYSPRGCRPYIQDTDLAVFDQKNARTFTKGIETGFVGVEFDVEHPTTTDEDSQETIQEVGNDNEVLDMKEYEQQGLLKNMALPLRQPSLLDTQDTVELPQSNLSAKSPSRRSTAVVTTPQLPDRAASKNLNLNLYRTPQVRAQGSPSLSPAGWDDTTLEGTPLITPTAKKHVRDFSEFKNEPYLAPNSASEISQATEKRVKRFGPGAFSSLDSPINHTQSSHSLKELQLRGHCKTGTSP